MSYVFAAAAVVTAGVGVYKTIKGANQVADAKKRAKLNIRPSYPIEQQYYDNQNLATSQAQTGLSDAERNYYNTNAERGLSTGINASLQTGEGPNSVSSLYDSFLRGQGAIATSSDQLRSQKLATLMQTNRELADQETNKWALDKYEPFKDEAKAIAGEKATGQSGVNSGLSTIAGAASSYASGTTKFGDSAGGGKSGVATDAQVNADTTAAAPYVTNTNPYTSNLYDSPNQTLQGNNDIIKQQALGDITSKYKDSPYSPEMYDYLSNTA